MNSKTSLEVDSNAHGAAAILCGRSMTGQRLFPDEEPVVRVNVSRQNARDAQNSSKRASSKKSANASSRAALELSDGEKVV